MIKKVQPCLINKIEKNTNIPLLSLSEVSK